MKNLTFLFVLMVVFATGCDKTDPVETDPVEIVLDHTQIIVCEGQTINAPLSRHVIYEDITPEGYSHTINIVQGNGGYEVAKTLETAKNYPYSKITTEAKVVDDSVIVITFKGDLPEHNLENIDCFTCLDCYLLTDSRGQQQTIYVTSIFI